MKTLYIISLTLFVSAAAYAQNDDALNIPVETDNQFPPDHSESEGLIEGSGAGVVIEPDFDVTTEFLSLPDLESIDSTSLKEEVGSELGPTSVELPCPKPCVCSIEGDTNNFITDCSGYDLTEFPTTFDLRTTTLNLQHNKLTEIPKEVASLQNLKVLNANFNQIMEISAGSVSELPELVTLKLGHNRLIEYPKDLKNSISLNKLEELDLGGNDMRTTLSTELFLNFKALRILTLPSTSTSSFAADVCESMSEKLETVCIETCEETTYECPNGPEKIEEGLLNAVLPGVIAFSSVTLDDDNNDPIIKSDTNNIDTENTAELSTNTERTDVPPNNTKESPKSIDSTEQPTKNTEITEEKSDIVQSVNEFSLRNAVNSAPQEIVASNTIVEDPKETADDVKIGAKTIASKTGGVDKSVIGIIVAGMIVVVAVITIKKNWSSIKKRFSSTPRPNERTARNANGTAPEEVPLQDKSPV